MTTDQEPPYTFTPTKQLALEARVARLEEYVARLQANIALPEPELIDESEES